VDELGVIALVAGLWIALAQPPGPGVGHSAYPARLGWLLVGLSMVLLLTGTLSPPSRVSSADPVTRPGCGPACPGPARGAASPPTAHRRGDVSGVSWSTPLDADPRGRN
jgi:hypothetical protein